MANSTQDSSQPISSLSDKIIQANQVLVENTLLDSYDDAEYGQELNGYLEKGFSPDLCSEDLNIESAIESLSQINSAVRSIRSSYLPIDFFKNQEGVLESTITDDSQVVESYENAFMRMLGMPLSDELLAANVGSSSGDTSIDSLGVLIYDIDSNSLAKISFELNKAAEETQKDVKTYILLERQKGKCDRKIKVNNDIFKNTSLDLDEDYGINLKNLYHNDFDKLSYLLIPAIQDSSISRCINEPSKIIPQPFEMLNNRVINSNQLRPSLLETIIKIRLDKSSGTLRFNDKEFSDQEVVNVDQDSFGLVESLFIVRLKNMLTALAAGVVKDIESILITISECDQHPFDSEDNCEVPSPASNRVPPETSTDNKDDMTKRNLSLLTNQKLIEDAIISLLNENLTIPELSSETNSSSMYDSQLISAILGVIDLPRRNIISKIDKINKGNDKKYNTEVARYSKSISLNLGIDIGIGAAHTVIFALALFSLPEESLTGLLSKKQFEILKNDKTLGKLLPNGGTKKSTLESVNELSRYLVSGFDLFKSSLSYDYLMNDISTY